MFKLLIAAGVVVIGMAVFVARQDERTTQEAAQQSANLARRGANDQHPQKDIENAERHTPSWYGFFRWPNGTTTLAIILTLIAIAWQSSETQRAAKGAFLNAEAVINSQRARLLFEVESRQDDKFRGVAIFTVFVVNQGIVPAEIISYGKAQFCETPTNALPPKPQYERSEVPARRFLVAKERHPVAEFSPAMPGNLWRLIAALPDKPPDKIGDLHIVSYGEVVYKDGMSSAERHSRYCYEFVRPPGVIGGTMHPAGPAEYNECA